MNSMRRDSRSFVFKTETRSVDCSSLHHLKNSRHPAAAANVPVQSPPRSVPGHTISLSHVVHRGPGRPFLVDIVPQHLRLLLYPIVLRLTGSYIRWRCCRFRTDVFASLGFFINTEHQFANLALVGTVPLLAFYLPERSTRSALATDRRQPPCSSSCTARWEFRQTVAPKV